MFLDLQSLWPTTLTKAKENPGGHGELRQESPKGAAMLKRMLVPLALALFVGLLPLVLNGKPASAAITVPSGFSNSIIVNGLSSPTAMAFAPDGRLFIAEQGGKVRIV